ncbi:hypothetical protein Tco_1464928 [Tanacetum coccineum]
MPANEEYVHLAWPLWSNLRVIPTHGKFGSLLPFLEQRILAMPVPPAGQVLPPDVLNTHTAWVKASKSGTSSDREKISRVQTGRRTICKLDNAQIDQIQENKKRRDEHAEIISSTKNTVSGSSAEASQRRKKSNYSSFQDLRSS